MLSYRLYRHLSRRRRCHPLLFHIDALFLFTRAHAYAAFARHRLLRARASRRLPSRYLPVASGPRTARGATPHAASLNDISPPICLASARHAAPSTPKHICMTYQTTAFGMAATFSVGDSFSRDGRGVANRRPNALIAIPAKWKARKRNEEHRGAA